MLLNPPPEGPHIEVIAEGEGRGGISPTIRKEIHYRYSQTSCKQTPSGPEKKSFRLREVSNYGRLKM